MRNCFWSYLTFSFSSSCIIWLVTFTCNLFIGFHFSEVHFSFLLEFRATLILGSFWTNFWSLADHEAALHGSKSTFLERWVGCFFSDVRSSISISCAIHNSQWGETSPIICTLCAYWLDTIQAFLCHFWKIWFSKYILYFLNCAQFLSPLFII